MTRARRGATDERTETQTRVAELLRVGKSNNEIAASLHISVKTVESHLTQIYRLAGARGRAEFLTQEREN